MDEIEIAGGFIVVNGDIEILKAHRVYEANILVLEYKQNGTLTRQPLLYETEELLQAAHERALFYINKSNKND